MMKHILLKRHLFWVLAPFAVYLISELIKGPMATTGQIFTAPSKLKTISSHELYNRTFVMTTAFAFITISLSFMAVTARNLLLKFRPRQLLPFITPLIFIVVMGLLITETIQLGPKKVCHAQDAQCHQELKGCKNVTGGNPHLIDSDEIFGYVSNSPCAETFFDAALNASQAGLSGRFQSLYMSVSLIFMLTIALAVFGAIGCLARPEPPHKDNEALIALKDLESNLFFTAIVFVSGIIYYTAWLAWPGFVFVENSASAKNYEKIVQGMTLFSGLSFSLMIAAYYIPLRTILVARLSEETRAERARKSKTIRKENEKEMHPFFAWVSSLLGTSDNQKEFYSYTLKILSPIIVAWFTTLLVPMT